MVRDDGNMMSYDVAMDLECLGGCVFSMFDVEWVVIANVKFIEVKVMNCK